MKFSIKHDSKNRKFFTVIGGKECLLKYEKVNDQLMDFKLLFVPKNLRGQGIGARVLEYAMNFARKNGCKVKPSCSYIGIYLDHHKEHQELIHALQKVRFNPLAV